MINIMAIILALPLIFVGYRLLRLSYGIIGFYMGIILVLYILSLTTIEPNKTIINVILITLGTASFAVLTALFFWFTTDYISPILSGGFAFILLSLFILDGISKFSNLDRFGNYQRTIQSVIVFSLLAIGCGFAYFLKRKATFWIFITSFVGSTILVCCSLFLFGAAKIIKKKLISDYLTKTISVLCLTILGFIFQRFALKRMEKGGSSSNEFENDLETQKSMTKDKVVRGIHRERSVSFNSEVTIIADNDYTNGMYRFSAGSNHSSFPNLQRQVRNESTFKVDNYHSNGVGTDKNYQSNNI